MNLTKERCIKLIGSTSIDEKEVEDALWASADEDADPDHGLRVFFSRIKESLSISRFCILPNHQIRFGEAVSEFRIGPVRAVLGHVLAEEINARNQNPTWKVEVAEVRTKSSSGLIETIDPVCWEAEIKASNGNLETESTWLVNTALSAIRILHPMGAQYGLYPQYGDEEIPVGLTPDLKKKFLSHSDTGISFGGFGIPKHYAITSDVVAKFKEDEVRRIVGILFDPPRQSVAERLARGLGWLSRGRQSRDKSERYLFFFTALETLLSAGKGTPVIDSISRHIAVILANEAAQRAELVRRVKGAYDIRSKLVHSGHRSVSFSEAAYLQELSEVTYGRVVSNLDLSVPFEDFQAGLANAGLGLAWPVR